MVVDQKRYFRQLIIPEIGEEGQKKLQESKVLVVGVGGLGSPVSLYLGAAGIGTIGLLDSDIVDISNLQRQIIHSTIDVGKAKVYSGQETLNSLNPNVKVVTFNLLLAPENAIDVIKNFDVIVACVDNLDTRYLLNQICLELNKPLVEGGVFNWDGTVHTIMKGQGPCYNCLYPQKRKTDNIPGVIGPIVGIIGSIQAMEVIKIILGTGKLLTDRMLLVDGLNANITEIQLEINQDCQLCN